MSDNLFSKQYSISIIRLFSLLCIITCHMLQFLEIELAWWINVGVQIFFCISGFLYGQREISEMTSFYAHRFKKILIPYLLAFIPFGAFVLIFASECFSWRNFVLGLFTAGILEGGNHLWFVSYILMCYLITPILEAYRDRYVRSSRSFCILAISAVAVTTVFFGFFQSYFSPAWMSCYVVGYAIGTNERAKYVKSNSLFVLFTTTALICNGVQIYIDYASNYAFYGTAEKLYYYYCQYSHVLLGVFLFLLLKRLFDIIDFTDRFKRYLDIIDNYSYETYLVHHFIILGPFSLMKLTTMLGLNILIILIGITAMTFILKKIETIVMGRFLQV